jgi:hypothetical protein
VRPGGVHDRALIDGLIVEPGIDRTFTANTTSGMLARTAVASAVEIWVTPGPQVTEATPVFPVALKYPMAMAQAQCSCRA